MHIIKVYIVQKFKKKKRKEKFHASKLGNELYKVVEVFLMSIHYYISPQAVSRDP